MSSDITTAEMKDGTWIAYGTGQITLLARGTTEQDARGNLFRYIWKQSKQQQEEYLSHMYDIDGPCFNCDH